MTENQLPLGLRLENIDTNIDIHEKPSPEKQLWQAVLLRAWLDLREKPYLKNVNAYNHMSSEASRSHLLFSSPFYENDLAFICRNADISVKAVKSAYEKHYGGNTVDDLFG